MSLEEARRASVSFGERFFVPPPRTVGDLTAILDKQKLEEPDALASARRRADEVQPNPYQPGERTRNRFAPTAGGREPVFQFLAEFFYERALAAREVGRSKQEILDLTGALQMAERALWTAGSVEILERLSVAEMEAGNLSRGLDYIELAMTRATRDDPRGPLIPLHARLATLRALAGDLDAADQALERSLEVLRNARRSGAANRWASVGWTAAAAEAEAALAETKGRYEGAERSYRQMIAALASDSQRAKEFWIDQARSKLAIVLLRRGRLFEAESEARTGLLGALGKQGRNSIHTANALRVLTRVISAQGRHVEAETLARAGLDILERVNVDPESLSLAFARRELARSLVVQERWRDALAAYEAILTDMRTDPETYRKYFAADRDLALALTKTGRPREAAELLEALLTKSQYALGDTHVDIAEIRGLLGITYAAMQDRSRALSEFRRATAILQETLPVDEGVDDGVTRPEREQRLALIFESYLGLLADIRDNPLGSQASFDVVAEAFHVSELARGRSVQRAVDASAARSVAKTPELSALAREEQDARKHLGALEGVLASLLSVPTDEQDPRVIAALRARLKAARQDLRTLRSRIDAQFPAYAGLVGPRPAVIEQVRAALRPGEALIATVVATDRSFVWAVPYRGAVAFATVPQGASELEHTVSSLRRALDPAARTVDDIPAFDVGLAHRLFLTLLEPVAAGWQTADSLLVVPHGPLSHVPFSVLPTKAITAGPDVGILLGRYRAVPWLVRSHAVTTLPSVTSLVTLRALPSGSLTRRPFVGFGAPVFTSDQTAPSEPRRARPAGAADATIEPRGMEITRRAVLNTQGIDSVRLATLPPLPETAEEIVSMARAMGADLTSDVFLGAKANEQAVKTSDLSRYRVIAFATHGLVPGDLDGLEQPALALSSPQVANISGDGVLSMDEILGLRLNADWVVLSACNTAAGKGAGADAISGLGRAFFYAGARSLLVSHWPVETTSTLALTTELFRRYRADPNLSRARQLQQTMVWLIDQGVYVEPTTGRPVFSYAHPIFWAPFSLIGDGGA